MTVNQHCHGQLLDRYSLCLHASALALEPFPCVSGQEEVQQFPAACKSSLCKWACSLQALLLSGLRSGCAWIACPKHYAAVSLSRLQLVIITVTKLEPVCRWGAPITAVQGAGCTSRKTLHPAPWRGSAGGDAAAAASHESRLRRSHPKLQQGSNPHLRCKAACLLPGAVIQPPLLSIVPDPKGANGSGLFMLLAVQ